LLGADPTGGARRSGGVIRGEGGSPSSPPANCRSTPPSTATGRSWSPARRPRCRTGWSRSSIAPRRPRALAERSIAPAWSHMGCEVHNGRHVSVSLQHSCRDGRHDRRHLRPLPVLRSPAALGMFPRSRPGLRITEGPTVPIDGWTFSWSEGTGHRRAPVMGMCEAPRRPDDRCHGRSGRADPGGEVLAGALAQACRAPTSIADSASAPPPGAEATSRSPSTPPTADATPASSKHSAPTTLTYPCRISTIALRLSPTGSAETLTHPFERCFRRAFPARP
jgi:hypothetical protein